MGSVRFYAAFKFGFPWKAFASIAYVSLVAAPTKTLHLNRLRPQTSSPEVLRLEILAMALLLAYKGRSSKSIRTGDQYSLVAVSTMQSVQ